ncbi:MAG TPA: DUF4266 domain-containing protein [Tepidisphaeraceae bacterium]|nr:DUF4266 domain-containing protein [Tepidisphaeraceae bacterium]
MSAASRLRSGRERSWLPRLGVVLLCATAPSCTVVKPWQRETLADRTMQPDRNPMATALIEHVWFSREAASGGRAVGGGGCGCN